MLRAYLTAALLPTRSPKIFLARHHVLFYEITGSLYQVPRQPYYFLPSRISILSLDEIS